ncbi:hypothetical protein [Flavobacterium sp.]|uniref:hypothetical protein n=1 Tax=Flavobacterium sp. TaxID=239 RepID=UPI0037BB5E55
MKNLKIVCFLFTFAILGSCNRTQKQNIPEEKPVSSQCYKAIYENDTISLKVNTLKSGKISGDMVMKIDNMPKKEGKVAGEFRGDTLFVAYTFIQGANDKMTFKNPMAFLKRGNELILGSGKIQTTMGASYFVKGEPIDFERVKYKFTNVDCTDK